MSGYDINRVLKNLGWLVGNPSFGSLYPALHALQKDGLVEVDVENRDRGPSRKIYSITIAGKQTFQHWIDQPAGPHASTKAFVMRLILAESYPDAALISQLHQRRAQVTAHRAALDQALATQDNNRGLGQQMALEYGLALANTELDWLDRTLAKLVKQLPTTEGRGD
jgi:DNA-binding PadR family transcriptional regulator